MRTQCVFELVKDYRCLTSLCDVRHIRSDVCGAITCTHRVFIATLLIIFCTSDMITILNSESLRYNFVTLLDQSFGTVT